jgi:hypothetical protein
VICRNHEAAKSPKYARRRTADHHEMHERRASARNTRKRHVAQPFSAADDERSAFASYERSPLGIAQPAVQANDGRESRHNRDRKEVERNHWRSNPRNTPKTRQGTAKLTIARPPLTVKAPCVTNDSRGASTEISTPASRMNSPSILAICRLVSGGTSPTMRRSCHSRAESRS